MGSWHREFPEEAERIASLPPSEQNAAERAAMAPAVEAAEARYVREKAALEEALGHDVPTHQSPGGRLRSMLEFQRDEERWSR